MATQYLIDKGHTRIACITGPLDKTPARLRLEVPFRDGSGGTRGSGGLPYYRRF